MISIRKHIDFLKARRSFHANRSSHLAQKDPGASAKHLHTSKGHEAIIQFLEDNFDILEEIQSGKGSIGSEPDSASIDGTQEFAEDLFSFSESDISSLPDTVRKTLNLSESDKLEGMILELIKIAGRPLSIRELIVGLYKKYQHEVEDRNGFASKLYRMSQAGTVKSAMGKRGYYELP